jgi:hypothetical protein
MSALPLPVRPIVKKILGKTLELIDWERLFPVQVLAAVTLAAVGGGVQLPVGACGLYFAFLIGSLAAILDKAVDEARNGRPVIAYLIVNELYIYVSVLLLGLVFSAGTCPPLL